VAQETSALGAVTEYWIDAWQRGVLFLEALIERGNTSPHAFVVLKAGRVAAFRHLSRANLDASAGALRRGARRKRFRISPLYVAVGRIAPLHGPCQEGPETTP
jgi:hypothetical protein